MKFRKRPIEVEAMQFTGTFDNATRIVSWVTTNGGSARTHDVYYVNVEGRPLIVGGIHIDTLEGVTNAAPDDWIIRGVAGEFYPCKPDIFAATYDPVEASCETCQGSGVVGGTTGFSYDYAWQCSVCQGTGRKQVDE